MNERVRASMRTLVDVFLGSNNRAYWTTIVQNADMIPLRSCETERAGNAILVSRTVVRAHTATVRERSTRPCRHRVIDVAGRTDSELHAVEAAGDL